MTDEEFAKYAEDWGRFVGENTPPKTLYKYGTWTGTARKILYENELFFASAEQFNDPLDCRIPLRYDLLTDEERSTRAGDYLAQTCPDLASGSQQFEAERDRLYKQGEANLTTEGLRKINEWDYNIICENVGIVCLAPSPLNSLMWSHYADSHGGFCVGFDFRELMEPCHEDNLREDVEDRYTTCYGVTYSSDMPEIIPISISDSSPEQQKDVIIRRLATKSEDWAYEGESRLITIGRAKYTLTLTSKMVTEVILGWKMCPCHKKEIQDILKRRRDFEGFDVRLYQAEQVDYSFSLRRCAVNY